MYFAQERKERTVSESWQARSHGHCSATPVLVIGRIDDLDNARQIMEYRFMFACLPTVTEKGWESSPPVIEDYMLANVADRMTKPSENA
jgi:hypothetical protein